MQAPNLMGRSENLAAHIIIIANDPPKNMARRANLLRSRIASGLQKPGMFRLRQIPNAMNAMTAPATMVVGVSGAILQCYPGAFEDGS